MKKILLTAFGRFGNYRANTTEIIAVQLNGTRLAGHLICSTTFSCEIPEENRGLRLLETARQNEECGIISLGMASQSSELCIETCAYNSISSKYCTARINGKPIDPQQLYDAPLQMGMPHWNTREFLHHCRMKAIPAKVSRDAGRFCCNHLMYQVRSLQLSQPEKYKTPFVFVHIPCSPEAIALEDKAEFAALGKVTMTIETAIRGLSTLLENATLPTG